MSRPKVSCLCPTWGRINTLGEAVDSFLRQTYTPRELLIMNDAPIRILNLEGVAVDKVATLDGGGGHWRIAPGVDILIMNNPRPFETLGHKYNALLELATGAIIAHWEDDDLWFPHHIDYAVHRLLANPDMYCTKNDMAFVLEKYGSNWRWSGYGCSVYESQMVFWRAPARKIRYSESNFAQSRTLLNAFANNGFLDHRQDAQWITYIFRWDAGFLHGQQLLTIADQTIDMWRAQNRDFGETLTVHTCLPYLEMALRDCEKPPATALLPAKALTAEQAKLIREWHEPTLRGSERKL